MAAGDGRTLDEVLDPAFAQVLDNLTVFLPFVLGIAGVHIVWKMTRRFLMQGGVLESRPSAAADVWTTPKHRADVAAGARPCEYGLPCLCADDPDVALDLDGGCPRSARVLPTGPRNGVAWTPGEKPVAEDEADGAPDGGAVWAPYHRPVLAVPELDLGDRLKGEDW